MTMSQFLIGLQIYETAQIVTFRFQYVKGCVSGGFAGYFIDEHQNHIVGKMMGPIRFGSVLLFLSIQGPSKVHFVLPSWVTFLPTCTVSLVTQELELTAKICL